MSSASNLSAGRRDAADPIATLLILGASGDLTGRLLLPGVARLVAIGRAPGLAVVGAGMEDWQSQWHDRVETVVADTPTDAPDGQGAQRLAELVSKAEYHQLDVTDPGALAALLAQVAGPVAVYFALPPAVTQRACEGLSAADLPPGTRLVLEKPFGTSVESAAALNATLASLVPENQLFRVDHFLGKATVLNLISLRFANLFLEPLWDRDHVEQVEIVFDESLGLEGRAGYYDHAGALRDMLQSHLLQVVALLTMEPPATLHERDVRDAKAAVLRATTATGSRRARYTAGRIGDRDLPDYTAEPGVDAARQTETLAEVTLQIANWRWAGVPFVLRSGKALGATRKEVVVTFRPVPHLPEGFAGVDEPTRLRIGFGPDTLGLEIDVDGPGDPFTLNRVSLAADLSTDALPPYGEVLDGIIHGDPLLSVRDDTAEQCWRIVAPVLAAWAGGEVPLESYPAGSSGPEDWPVR